MDLRPWRWSNETESLSRTDRLPSGVISRLEVTQKTDNSFLVNVDAQQAGPGDLEDVRATIARWLSLSWDPKPAIAVARTLDTSIGAFISEGGGRLLRCSTFYEDFAKTVCTINTAWSGTNRMVDGLIDEIGGGLFPSAAQVVEAGEGFLRDRVRLGFRARVLFEATEQLLKRRLIDESGRQSETEITYGDLIDLRGIGPYAANHLMVLLHDFSRIPVDSSVARLCKERYGFAPEEIEPYFDRWGEYRFLGYKLPQVLERSMNDPR